MKPDKSSETNEVTPSKKKLKQARLPFKIITETSPAPITPVTPPSRKRKLSATDAETVSKAVKISKENESEDTVVISDDESKDGITSSKFEKLPNPYVKIVDAARKKKIQKTKASKKKKNAKKSTDNDIKENGSVDSSDTADHNDCEEMEVDEPTDQTDKTSVSEINKELEKETDSFVDKCVNNIIVLENSNSSDCQENSTNINTLTESSKANVSIKKNDQSEENDSNVQDEQVGSNLNESSSKEDDKEKSPQVEQLPVTPKRSMRNKLKLEENNNKSSPSSKLNESITSNPSTPKQDGSSSVTKHDESLNESISLNANLTPKQTQKKNESAKKREEREKEKLEREKKKQQEKEERLKQKQEKEEQRKKEREEKEEAKRKEREEKEEQKKKEREEKEKQKELERKEKEEQKRKEREEKEDQKRKEREAKEEEKKKKQEALELEKQEQELKKKKAAEAFVNFFVPKQKSEKDQSTIGAVNNSMLSSFTIKSEMRLAPTTRVNLTEDKVEALEKYLTEQNVDRSQLYIKSLKDGLSKPLSSGKTWPLTDKDDDDDVILVEDELPPDGAAETISCEPVIREKLRPKLLSFHQNRRPPYWGTWRKKSAFVKPRRPFGQDEKQLDYDVDSDEEWEEEQEGESIDGSAAGSDDEQGPDEYEVDNEVFVPHGYLSDEEATMDEDDVLSLSPETQKARLKHLEDEFESELKKPTEKLKPRLYGLLWENSEGGKPENCADAIWNYFGKLSMIMNDPTPFLQPSSEPAEVEKKKVKKKKVEGEQSPKTDKKKKKIDDKEKQEKAKPEKKAPQETKNNQPGINMFLKRVKPTAL